MSDETRCAACGKVRQRFAPPVEGESTPALICTDCRRAGVRPGDVRRPA